MIQRRTNAHLMSLIIDTCTVTTKLVMFIMLAMMRIIQDDTTKKNTDGKKTPCFLNASTEWVNARTQSTKPSSINPAKLVAKRILSEQRMPDSESTDVFCFARVGTNTIHSSRSRSMKVLWEWSPGRHSLRNILLETSSRCYDCKKHIAEQINVQHFLPMILFVNYNSCMCFQDIFCIISHKICVSLQLQRWINSTLRNNEKSTAVLLRECHPLFTSE